MSDTLLALVPTYGLTLLAIITTLSCMGLPLPASIAMMLMGSFAAAGDFSLTATMIVAAAAAILGDHMGYGIGRLAGTYVQAWMERTPRRRRTRDRAVAEIEKRGALAIFFSRWLVAPLGPYVNLTAGAAHFRWRSFAVWGALGEVLWVTGYVGLGYLFSDNVLALIEMAGNMSGLLAGGAVAALLGWRLLALLRRPSGGKA